MKALKQEKSQEQLAKWADTFLRGEGNNIPLADGLNKQQRWWINAVQFPLNKLVRCCGPEANMEYRESEQNWNRRIDSFVEYIKSNGKLPPLIATYNDGVFSVRDGNHRLGACEKLGIEFHDTFIWCDSEEDFETVKRQLQANSGRMTI